MAPSPDRIGPHQAALVQRNCGGGHQLASVRLSDTIVPHPSGDGTLQVQTFEILCLSCGLTLEQIRNYRPPRTRSKKGNGNGESTEQQSGS